MYVLGLMSGTSADGVDAALVGIRGSGHDLKIKLKAFRTFPYPTVFRERLVQAMTGGTVEDVCHLNGALGEWFSRAALKVLTAAGVPPRRVALIGSHGQTLHHLPKPRREPVIGSVRSTLQLGAPAVIAERTGITTVADFRSRDMAAGGEGAPLTPYLHFLLFRHPSRARAVINIGGISNPTDLPAAGPPQSGPAFDMGPGEMGGVGGGGHLAGGRRQIGWRRRQEPDPYAEVARDLGRAARPDSRGAGLGRARAGGRGVRGLRLPACAGRPVQSAPSHRRQAGGGAGDDCSALTAIRVTRGDAVRSLADLDPLHLGQAAQVHDRHVVALRIGHEGILAVRAE